MKTSTVVVAGVSVAAAASAVYYLYKQRKARENAGPARDMKKEKKASQGKLLSEPDSHSKIAKGPSSSSNKSASKAPRSKTPTAKSSDTSIVTCDSSLEDIAAVSPEKKEKLFYELLMRSEFLIQQGATDRALDYLIKALGMIPNPGEVLVAFEKTLPEPIFKALIERLQKEGRKRVKDYFEDIQKSIEGIAFASRETTNEVTGQTAEHWFMTTDKDFREGDIIFQEEADMIIRGIGKYSDSCLCCLREISDDAVVCERCNDAHYCSAMCRGKDYPESHCYVCCGDNKEAAKEFAELLDHCRSTNTSAGLLLFKYISTLLTAELKHSKPEAEPVNGPFAHYDHLRPAFRQPTNDDLKEAKSLRFIFTRSNPNMQDFLTDDIYAAMKYTLLFNCYGFGSVSANESSVEAVRNAKAPEWIGLYHIASHLSHSCAPNTVAELCDGKIVVKALENISKGTSITVSYIPHIAELDKDKRQIKLLSQFGIVCDCHLCSA